jgi:O-antigen/teichoic acid export membrane protein
VDAPTAINDEPTKAASAVKQRSLTHRILSGGAWALAGRVGSMGSLFLLNVLLFRTLPTRDYSAFLAAASVIPFLAMLATLGVPFPLIRALRGKAPQAAVKRAALRGGLTLTLLGCLAAAVGYYGAASLLPAEGKWRVLRDFPALVIAWFSLSALGIVCANYLQAEDDFRGAALVGARSGGLIPNCLTLAAAATAAFAGFLSLGSLLTIQALFFLAALGVAARLINRTFTSPAAHAEPGAPPRAAEVGAAYSPRWYLAEGWPDLINQLIAVALVEGDLLWIAWLADEQTVAHYGAIRNLRLLVTAPLLVAAIALPPFVAELYAKGDGARLERLLRTSATALSAPSLAALAVLLAAPEFVIRLVFGAELVGAAPALRMIAAGAIVFVLTGNTAVALTMTGRHRDLMVVSVASLVLYCAMSPPLVARYGVWGAAAAFTLQIALQRIALTLWVKRVVGVWTIPLCSWKAMKAELAPLIQRLKRGQP